MKKLSRIGLLVLISALLICCKKDDNVNPFECSDRTSDEVAVKTLVNGNWQWIESRRYDRLGEHYYTPESEGYDEYLKIFKDTIVISKVPGTWVKRTYKILKEKEITNWPEDEATVLVTYELDGSRASYYQIESCNEFLYLYQSYRSDIASDKIYKRLK